MNLCQTELFEIELFIGIKRVIGTDNLQWLVCHRTKSKQNISNYVVRNNLIAFHPVTVIAQSAGVVEYTEGFFAEEKHPYQRVSWI